LIFMVYTDVLTSEEYDAWYYTDRGKYISGLEKDVLLKMIKPSAISHQPSAIDIACGTGYFTQFLGNYCGSIVGVDTSMEMIKYAMKNRKDSNIRYLVADAESLPFKNGSFDMSVSMTAINFFKNPVRAVTEAIRVSKKRIVLGVLNKWSILSVFKRIKAYLKETSYSDACFYNQREIVNMLSAFPQIKKAKKIHAYFLPFPRLQSILSKIEMIIPSWLPFGGFMGIAGEIEKR